MQDRSPFTPPSNETPAYQPMAGSSNLESTANANAPLVRLSGDRKRDALLFATQLYREEADWLRFFREVLGIDGIVRQLFPTQDEYRAFEKTDEFAKIEQMMFALRAAKKNPKPNIEPTRVITVRLPASVHEALRAQASERQTSINRLCISKLLHALAEFREPNTPDQELPQPLADRQQLNREGVGASMSNAGIPENSTIRQSTPESSADSPYS